MRKAKELQAEEERGYQIVKGGKKKEFGGCAREGGGGKFGVVLGKTKSCQKKGNHPVLPKWKSGREEDQCGQ